MSIREHPEGVSADGARRRDRLRGLGHDLLPVRRLRPVRSTATTRPRGASRSVKNQKRPAARAEVRVVGVGFGHEGPRSAAAPEVLEEDAVLAAAAVAQREHQVSPVVADVEAHEKPRLRGRLVRERLSRFADEGTAARSDAPAAPCPPSIPGPSRSGRRRTRGCRASRPGVPARACVESGGIGRSSPVAASIRRMLSQRDWPSRDRVGDESAVRARREAAERRLRAARLRTEQQPRRRVRAVLDPETRRSARRGDPREEVAAAGLDRREEQLSDSRARGCGAGSRSRSATAPTKDRKSASSAPIQRFVSSDSRSSIQR